MLRRTPGQSQVHGQGGIAADVWGLESDELVSALMPPDSPAQ